MAVHTAFKECDKGQCKDAASHRKTATKSIILCDKPIPKDADQTAKDPCKSPCECLVFRREKGAKPDAVWDFVIPDDDGDIEDVTGFVYRCYCVQLNLTLPDGFALGDGTCERPKLIEKKTKIYCVGKCKEACNLFRIEHDKGENDTDPNHKKEEQKQKIAKPKAKWEHVPEGLDAKNAVKYDPAYYYVCVCLKVP